MTVTDEYLKNNEEYAKTLLRARCRCRRASTSRWWRAWTPGSTCTGSSGLNDGEAHVIRNAGGVVTDDEIRSLAISQRLLGTKEIILIHHTDCGMLTFTDDGFKQQIQDETGLKPEWAAEAFQDVDEDVRQSLRRIEASPFVTKHESLRGFVFDVATGQAQRGHRCSPA